MHVLLPTSTGSAPEGSQSSATVFLPPSANASWVGSCMCIVSLGVISVGINSHSSIDRCLDLFP